MSVVRIATRGSDLALAQASWAAERIASALGVDTELVVVSTMGDRIQDVSLAKIGGKGLFIKEIEETLLAGEADVAIHSAKDLPAEIAEGCVLAAFPERADPRDALVCREPTATLRGLPKGARVGTGSTRRTALLRAARPDLEIVPLRGNVPTRIAKIESDDLAAVVLACAGLDRLGRADAISERIATDVMLPAVCQGMLALEGRAGEALCDDLAVLTSDVNATAAVAERSFLKRLGGDCTIPLAAHCEVSEDGGIQLRGLVASLDGERIARARLHGAARNAEALGRDLAESVLAAGGRKILDELRAAGDAQAAS
ncbi:MAG: hydroxymethylbilane synthase [Deltaproteobacteria bacterium]|nr:hydroxymethylbilane synthase [Deltaproteobacteria bacterium]